MAQSWYNMVFQEPNGFCIDSRASDGSSGAKHIYSGAKLKSLHGGAASDSNSVDEMICYSVESKKKFVLLESDVGT